MIYPSPLDHQAHQAVAETTVAARANADEGTSRTLWGDAFGRLKKNKLAVVAAIWILFIILVAATADLWVPQTLGDPNATGANMAAESRLPPLARASLRHRHARSRRALPRHLRRAHLAHRRRRRHGHLPPSSVL